MHSRRDNYLLTALRTCTRVFLNDCIGIIYIVHLEKAEVSPSLFERSDEKWEGEKHTSGMKKGQTPAECPVFAWQLLTLNELRFSYRIVEAFLLSLVATATKDDETPCARHSPMKRNYNVASTISFIILPVICP